MTGITGAERFLCDAELDDLGARAIKSVDPRPNGAYFVDMPYDPAGRPRITEVNAGHYGSCGVIHCVTERFNLPYFTALCGLGERPAVAAPLLNPLPADVYQIYGLGLDPVLAPMSRVHRLREEYEARLKIAVI